MLKTDNFSHQDTDLKFVTFHIGDCERKRLDSHRESVFELDTHFSF